jgi:hypothetical protein
LIECVISINVVLETTLQEEVLIPGTQDIFVRKYVFVDLLYDEHRIGSTKERKSGLEG